MHFKELYEKIAIQKKIPVLIDDIANIIKESGLVADIVYQRVDLDTNTLKGSYFTFKRIPKPYQSEYDVPLSIKITFDSKFNECWSRFVCCKELMHFFDSGAELVETETDFFKHLYEWTEQSLPDPSPAMKSEYTAFWRALAVLCPLSVRESYVRHYSLGKISNYDIALELKIPEQYVPTLMGQNFERMVRSLTN
jgi:hypothetical protein